MDQIFSQCPDRERREGEHVVRGVTQHGLHDRDRGACARVAAPDGRMILSGGNPDQGKYLGPVGVDDKAGLFGRTLGLRVQIPRAEPNNGTAHRAR